MIDIGRDQRSGSWKSEVKVKGQEVRERFMSFSCWKGSEIRRLEVVVQWAGGWRERSYSRRTVGKIKSYRTKKVQRLELGKIEG